MHGSPARASERAGRGWPVRRLSAAPGPEASSGALRRAVFIDKDGTLVENVPYNVDPALVRFTRHAIPALRRLADAGYLLVVVSNQPGLAQQRFGLPALQELANTLDERLRRAGVPLTGFYVCPHAPPGEHFGGRCRCRKPAPGMLLDAAREHNIDLYRSWMIGDILDDIEAGWRAGCGSVLMDVGNETEWRWSPIRIPDFRVPDLGTAASSILSAPVVARARSLGRHPTIRRPGAAAARSRSAA